MNSNNMLSSYDNLLDDLTKEMNSKPNEKLKIIMKAIKKTDCPYLRAKIQLLNANQSTSI